MTGGAQLVPEDFALFGGSDPGDQRRGAVKPHVVVFSAFATVKSGGVAVRVVDDVAEITALPVPGVLLKRAGEQLDIRAVIVRISEFAGGILQDFGAADGHGGADDREDVFGVGLVNRPLRRIVVPAARVVKIIPGADHAGVAAAAGPGQRIAAGQEIIILLEPRIEKRQHFAVVGTVPQFKIEIKLNRNRRAVVDERVFAVAAFGQVGVQVFDGALDADFEQAEPDEARIPRIKAVPAPPRTVVAHVFAVKIGGVDHVGHGHGGHPVLSEGRCIVVPGLGLAVDGFRVLR